MVNDRGAGEPTHGPVSGGDHAPPAQRPCGREGPRLEVLSRDPRIEYYGSVHDPRNWEADMGEKPGEGQSGGVNIFGGNLKERTRERVPLNWAMTQNNL